MENKKVEIKDYEQEQHELLIALRMVGLNIDYITTDLIYRVLQVHKCAQDLRAVLRYG